MPEYPDLQLYLHALRSRVEGRVLRSVRVLGPNVLRTFDPKLSAVEGRVVRGVRRLGKRIVFELDAEPDALFVVIHLMIAGRLQWVERPVEQLIEHPTMRPSRSAIAWFDLDEQRLVLTESGKRKRAGIWVVRGEAALRDLDPGGLEVLEASPAAFAAVLRSESHTLKRALTDPSLFSGIGNAYSDEILHHARLSPFVRTTQCSAEDVERLRISCIEVLRTWEQRLLTEVADRWPTRVTAFRPEMSVHGRFGEPCPVCQTLVQRVVFAQSEFNYCARCQTGGKVLADRSLSRLLRADWPRTIEELEERRRDRRDDDR